MSYYRKNYYRRNYRRKNNNPDLVDMFFSAIFGLITLIGTLIFMLFRVIFKNRNKIKGLFKINEKPSDDLDTNVIINTNDNQISEPEKMTVDQEERLLTQKILDRYSLKGSLLTEAERNFLNVLKDVIGENYRIESQVQLSRIVTPTDSSKNFTNYTDFNKIKAKSIDFVLYDSGFKPYLAIELDDRSHFRWDRMKRDQFVNDLMESVGLRIIHIPVSYSYNIEVLKRKIFEK